ncbi:MAG: CBS domain-containing protein [Nitrospinae bacterium]|nr:CBS domain-containing protein [Nitrospinota bacterium]MZH47254.1 CBS domain-containing protein [Nitrospinota bacterium]
MDPVSSFMVATVKDIDAEVSVKEAAKMLSDFGIGSLLVKKDSEYVGMLSEQEVTRELVALGKDPSTTNVGSIMNPDIDYVDQSELMSQAIAIMREKKLRYLVVRNGENVVGILSVKDLLAYYEKWFELTI